MSRKPWNREDPFEGPRGKVFSIFFREWCSKHAASKRYAPDKKFVGKDGKEHDKKPSWSVSSITRWWDRFWGWGYLEKRNIVIIRNRELSNKKVNKRMDVILKRISPKLSTTERRTLISTMERRLPPATLYRANLNPFFEHIKKSNVYLSPFEEGFLKECFDDEYVRLSLPEKSTTPMRAICDILVGNILFHVHRAAVAGSSPKFRRDLEKEDMSGLNLIYPEEPDSNTIYLNRPPLSMSRRTHALFSNFPPTLFFKLLPVLAEPNIAFVLGDVFLGTLTYRERQSVDTIYYKKWCEMLCGSKFSVMSKWKKTKDSAVSIFSCAGVE